MLDDRAARRLSQLCSLRVERDLHTVLMHLRGEFDLACERAFLEELRSALDEQTKTLVLDLGALNFIDSTGLRMLVSLEAGSRQDGFDFTVLCGEGEVRRVLRLSGVDALLPLISPSGRVPHCDTPV